MPIAAAFFFAVLPLMLSLPLINIDIEPHIDIDTLIFADAYVAIEADCRCQLLRHFGHCCHCIV